MKTPHRFLLGALLSVFLFGGCKDLFPPDPDKDPDPITKTLPGTGWRLISYTKSSGEVVAVSDATNSTPPVTLFFEDAACKGSAPCNGYGGECKFDPRGAGTIDINGIFSTKIACDRLDLENLYLGALGSAEKYTIDSDGLHILVKNTPNGTVAGMVAVLNFAPYEKDPKPEPATGGIQYRKVTVASDVFELHQINADGTGESTITTWQNFLSDAPRNGITAFLGQRPGTTGFSVMTWNRNSAAPAPQTVVAGGDINFILNTVALSPDGKQIAVVGYDNKAVPPGKSFNVYVYRLDGTAIDTLLDAEALAAPVFSPDGSQIAWYGSNNTVRVGTIGSNAPDMEIATNAISFTLPCPGRLEWVANSRGVVYVGAHSSIAKSDETDLWMVPLPAGAPVNMTNDPNIDCWPTSSPDGHQIAFVRQTDGGTYSIYRIQLAANGMPGTPEPFGPNRLVNMVLHDLFPQWSPDGKQLLYTSFTSVNPSGAPGMSGTLERMSVEDHIPVQLATSAERGFWEK